MNELLYICYGEIVSILNKFYFPDSHGWPQICIVLLKYELQLAYTEMEILKSNQYPRGRFQEVGMLPGLKSLGSPQASNPFNDAGSSSARDFHSWNADENYIRFQRLLAIMPSHIMHNKLAALRIRKLWLVM